tara:strand:- start:1016 stop:1204 length:189 start_codon:yes stop_codon:yes gene_type:complete
LTHITNEDGSCDAYYKNSKMQYTDYIDELQHRTESNMKGKDITSRSIGYFSGFSFAGNKNKK